MPKPLRHIDKHLKHHRAALRNDMPEPEHRLWQRIRGEQLGAKFRRQHSIGDFILDFFSPTLDIAIELDGKSHYDTNHARRSDAARDAALREQGIETIRFTNAEVMENLDGVCGRIESVVKKRKSHPLSLPL